MIYSTLYDNIYQSNMLKAAMMILGMQLPYEDMNFLQTPTQSFIKINDIKQWNEELNTISKNDINGINYQYDNLIEREISPDSYWFWEISQKDCIKKELKWINQKNQQSSYLVNEAETYKQLKKIAKKENPEITKEELYEQLLMPYNHEKVKTWNPDKNRFNISYIWRYGDWNKEFTKTWNLLDHVRMHEGIKPFQCKECLKTFTQKGNLKKHLLIRHSEVPLKDRKKFKCKHCPKWYTERYNLIVRNNTLDIL